MKPPDCNHEAHELVCQELINSQMSKVGPVLDVVNYTT